MLFNQLMLHAKLLRHSAQLTEQLVLQSLDAQRQYYKQVAFWELMEIVDGYLQLGQLLLHVHYTLTVQLLQGQHLHNAKLGDQHAYQMAQLAFQNQLVHRIQLKLPVEMLELMEHASG